MHMHVKHDKHGCIHVGSHLQFLYMYTYMHACMCVHVRACGDNTPCPQMPSDNPPHPPVPSPEPQGAQNTKIQ